MTARTSSHVPIESAKSDKQISETKIIETEETRARAFFKAFVLACATIVLSSCLIAFNKYLIHPGRFPYAVPLVLGHMITSSVLSTLLFLLVPSLYPSLNDPVSRKQLTPSLFLKGILPITICFVGQLILSNSAYLHSSVAFLQMMKESNLVLVYILSLAASLEIFRQRNAVILVIVVFATCLTIKGELQFSRTGFALQGTSQLLESSKIVLQAVLLISAGCKLDALTYVLCVAPMCTVMLLVVAGFLSMMSVPLFAVPTLAELIPWLPMLFANACIAFALNVTSALFVKNSSAVSFILAGVVKDAGIVLSGALVLGESISRMQVLGFGVQLGAIFTWSMIKASPERFEQGVLQGWASILSGRAVNIKDDKLAKLAREDYGGAKLPAKVKAEGNGTTV